ncbi:MAG: hypothetical protein CVV24_03875 [Ignavibacteriae bacterium HGW-Ignavibacteriae-3]|nr:MAG: hypothetical protein CVV24_03875 [Ignavibacteriae bacterium HGW-Ignavibacteriae-3]
MKKNMKTLIKYILILALTSSLSYPQTLTKISVQKEVESELSITESYPIDARPLLERFSQANGIDLNNIEPIPASLKKTAWNFSVGSKYTWWASDLRTGASPSFYQVSATCQAVGTNCYVFVQDSLWTSRVDQNAVDSVRIAFDSKTPSGSINPNKGIYQNNVDTFGNPPNVDGDSKIIILILDIRDGYSGSGGYTAGYFYGYNQGNGTWSNKAEIYYLDGNPLNLKTSGGLTTGMSTTAHEFQHMIQYNYHGIIYSGSQETFYNEGLSLVAEVINGYPLYSQSSYYNISTNRYMLDWNPNNNATDVLKDYSRAARFFLYLKEQFGVGVLKGITQSSKVGMSALDLDALPAVPTSRRFSDIVVDWWVANYLNDRSVDAKWGYIYPNVPKVSSTSILNPNVTSSDAVYKLGAQYLSFTSGKNLRINFDTQNNASIKLKAIKTGPAGKQVVDVTPAADFNVTDFGTNYTDVTFLICQNDFGFMNTSQVNKGPYTYYYYASGTYENKPIEIAYDLNQPTGVFNWPAGDSVAVVFDGVPNTMLDSIRVALRTLAPMNGGVWRKATTGTALFGKQLAGPITATGKTYVSGTYPPSWPNWVKIDLRSLKIDAGSSFVVSFLIDGAYQAGLSTGPNRIMNTYQPTSNGLTYTTNNGIRKWYNFYVDSSAPQDSFIVYLMRAYVSDKTTGVEKVIELMPATYSLNQNYPNPFNPSTVISYNLPAAGHVSLKIYDLMGREVATLVDKFQQAGSHNSQFSILNSQFASGIYFYTIKTGNFIKTKKMVLMK